jgi:signal transduction histidine kinase/DNA-binding response OmpR family regulator
MTATPAIKLQTILIVTGAAIDVAVLETALVADGYRVMLVARADSALDAVRAGGVALVLLDAAQAGSARYELCALLRAAAKNYVPPILLMTSGLDQDAQQRAIAAGASGCLPLPFDPAPALRQIRAQLPVRSAADGGNASPPVTPEPARGEASHALAEALREGQNQLLEMVARGAPLRQTLNKLMLLIESQSPGVLCSTLLLDENGKTIRTGAGPSLPEAYMAAIDGLDIGPSAGSCGTAMFRKEAVIVTDIRSDPLWTPYEPIATRYGLRACWAMPILVDQDTVVGSFAMYYREVRSPNMDDMRLIGVATHLAGIAIARTRREKELLRHREHLQELVAERTTELQCAIEQAEQANQELATALANLSLTQDELVRREKLSALGALVAGVAHEMNTPIGNSLLAAGGMAERTRDLRNMLAEGVRRSVLESYLDEASQADDIVMRNLTRAAKLLRSFREIAVDIDSTQRRRFALDNVVSELMRTLQTPSRHLPAEVEVTLNIPPGLEMDSYPGPLCQVLEALFDNSVLHGFAARRRGRITITAAATEQGEVMLSFADDGKGIAPANLGRVYDPFFTTTLGAGGSGLGLHVAHNIVTGVLGGRILASSPEGAGTTFTLLLPSVAPL